MTVVARYASREEMERLITLRMEEGFVAAMGQMDAILAEDES
jgi:hypothetical protein